MKKKNYGLIFGLFAVFILFSCEKDLYEDYELQKTNYDVKMKKITVEDFNKKIQQLKNKPKIERFMKSTEDLQKMQSRTTIGDNIVLYTDDIKEITYEDYTSYSMYLRLPTTTNNVFYNFVIEEKNDDIRYSVNKYITTNNWLNNKDQDFQGTISTFMASSSAGGVSGSDILTHYTDIEDGAPIGTGGNPLDGGSISGLTTSYPTNCIGVVETVIYVEPKMCSQNVHWPWTPTFNNPCYASIQAHFTQTTYYRCLGTISGGGGGGSGSGGSGGGGGSGGNTGGNFGGGGSNTNNPADIGGGPASLTSIVTPIEPPKTPCEELKKITLSNSAQQTLRDLKTASSGTSEVGFYMKETTGNAGQTYTSYPVIPPDPNNAHSLDISVGLASGLIKGAMHCHTDPTTTGSVNMFSPADLRSLRNIANNYNGVVIPKDYSEFTVMLSVGAGQFALKLKDFHSFNQNYNANRVNFDKELYLLYKKSTATAPIETQIKNFLTMLKKHNFSGVGLYKATEATNTQGVESITGWKEQTLNTNGDIVELPCN